MSSKYPSKSTIHEWFSNLESQNFPEFFKHIAPDVDWTVMGTHPAAGRYQNLKEFQEGTLKRIGGLMKPPGLKLKVCNVIGGGEQEWATVEMVVNAECKNGLKFDNAYAWVIRFDEKGTVVEVRAYLDSQLVKQAVEENECPSRRAPIPME